MMITLRLYRQHDLDLITLYKNPDFSLPYAIKKALNAYVRSETLYIKQPKAFELDPTKKIPKIVQMHINLNPDTDNDIILWLKDIKEGYRNSILKNLIRGYLIGPCIYPYRKNKNAINDFESVTKSFEENVKQIDEVRTKGKDNKKKTKKNKDIAAEILKGNGRVQNTRGVFIERIDEEEKYNKQQVEQIADDILKEKTKEIKEEKPIVKKPIELKDEKAEVIKENDTKPKNDIPIESNDDEDGLDSMIGMIDEMMNF